MIDGVVKPFATFQVQFARGTGAYGGILIPMTRSSLTGRSATPSGKVSRTGRARMCHRQPAVPIAQPATEKKKKHIVASVRQAA